MPPPLLFVAVLFVARSVAAPTSADADADSKATPADGTLDVRLDQLNTRVKALPKLTHTEEVSAMSKCSKDPIKERKENRCNSDKDCKKNANTDGPKCQTKDCNYCTDGMTDAKCYKNEECAAGFVCGYRQQKYSGYSSTISRDSLCTIGTIGSTCGFHNGCVDGLVCDSSSAYGRAVGTCRESLKLECGMRCSGALDCISGRCVKHKSYRPLHRIRDDESSITKAGFICSHCYSEKWGQIGKKVG